MGGEGTVARTTWIGRFEDRGASGRRELEALFRYRSWVHNLLVEQERGMRAYAEAAPGRYRNGGHPAPKESSRPWVKDRESCPVNN